jgi:glycosyltransferase involved in cell wall biosynthesis
MVRLAVLVSDTRGSALDQRAHALFGRLSRAYEITCACHEAGARNRIKHFLAMLRATQPALIYIIDPIYAGVMAALLYRATHYTRVVLDTGDLVYELARELARHAGPQLALIRGIEQIAFHMADAIVVRSTFHRDWLMQRAYGNISVIPDGVDLTIFHPTDAQGWRAQHGMRPNELVVGGVGSMIWNVRRGTCFGWDLVEALASLRDLPIRGLLIGDGDGRARLEARARVLGIDQQIVFTGRVPYAELNPAINAVDMALLTQMNSPISWVRTTGKLPLYLACDRYILASAVGEAARLLEPYDMLLPYEGMSRDEQYPHRLAEKIRALNQERERLRLRGLGVQLAHQHFDYDRLAQQLESTIAHTLND